MSANGTLVVRDDELIRLLCAGHKVADCASTLGISTTTVYRRMNAPGFKDRLTEARATEWQPVGDRLRSAADRAVAVLAELLDDAEQPPATRLRAASAVLQHALEFRRSAEQAAQIAAIQARLDEIQQRAEEQQCDDQHEPD